MLQDLVAKGELPPVDERLPVEEDILIVEPIEEIGQYGGTWRRAFLGVADFHAYGRLNYEPMVRWPRDPRDPIRPGIAKKWEWSDDGKTLTLYLRKGMKWSDGEPFTVDDILFWWEDIALNTDLSPSPPSEWVVQGEPMTVEKVDDYMVKLHFKAPNGLAIRMLAFHGNQWPLAFERFGFFAPKHYLQQFHPKYNAEITDYKLFNEKADDFNTERPALTPWPVKEWEPGANKLIAERNPYYWKTDPEGNQLPYIDRIRLDLVENSEVVNLKAANGELDFQFRRISIASYSVFMENREKGNYRVLRWPTATGAAPLIMPNQTIEEPVLRELFREKKFRQALSLAINRERINEVSYLGLGVPRQATVLPQSPYYVPEAERMYADYNPDEANRLLDEIGLTERDDEGFRLRPDGKTLEVTVETTATSGPFLDALELVKENWDAVGVKTAIKSMTRELYWPRVMGNQVEIATWGMDRGLEPMVDPIWLFPYRDHSWYAVLWGIWYATGGQKGEEPPEEVRRAQKLFDEFKATVDPDRQIEIGKELVRISAENTWLIGTVGMMPSIVIAKNNFRNIPEEAVTDWIFMSPGNLDPPQFFFKQT